MKTSACIMTVMLTGYLYILILYTTRACAESVS